MENDGIFRKIWLFFLDFIETIVIALAIFVVVYRFLFQPHQVKGNSMYDNFYDGEYLLTNKIVYQLNEPQLSDVIVFKAPKNEDYDYIKRIVALPGDRVMLKGGEVYVNAQLFDESGYLDADIFTRPGSYMREGTTVTVPQNSYLVFGDNRSGSSDSREWGIVPKENIVGKAWIKYWPLNKIGIVDRFPNLK
ncbi:MAG: signal peptidase I [Patescibacteria group bacterium]|nr:signal peptidase I [Patescibacteria group bacterium]